MFNKNDLGWLFAQGPIGASFSLGSKLLAPILGTNEIKPETSGLATGGALALGAGALYGPGGAAYAAPSSTVGGAGYMAGESALPTGLGNYGTASGAPGMLGLNPAQAGRLGTMLKVAGMGQTQPYQSRLDKSGPIYDSRENRRKMGR